MIAVSAPLDTLPAELEAHRDRLRGFLDSELLPAERAHGVHDEAEAPPELVRWARRRSSEHGLFRLLQPVAGGGGGLGPLAAVALHETIGASGAILGRFTLGGDGGLLALATGEQRERLLAPVLRGELDAALAITDARDGPRTTAVRRGDGFLLSGVKAFVTGGVHADLLLTLARVTDGAGPAGSTVFVVPRDAPGVTLRRALRTLDGAVHAEIELRDVSVPARDVLGQVGEGVPRARASLTALRLRVAAIACGTGRWALEYAVADASRPHRSGTPLGDRGEVRATIGESAMDLYAARSATWIAARHADAGHDAEVEATMAKVIATEAVTRIVDRAIQLAGGAAVVADHPLALAYRRIRTWRIAEGTTEMLRLSVARALLPRRNE